MMRPNTKHFFTPEEQERIRQTVALAERSTSGEIATMVVTESDSYPEAEVLGGVLLAGLSSLLVAVGIGHVTIWTYVPLIILFFFPFRLLFSKVSTLKVPFVGRERLEEAVRRAALQSFYEKGLHRTRHETGILIYLSLLEHTVWILGDRGINEKIAPEFWDVHARALAIGVKEGRGCDVLCAVIEDCGVELARHFPRRDDDMNELSDHLII